MLSIDLLILVSHTKYNGLQIFAELDFPVLNTDRERWIFLLLVLSTEGTALQMKPTASRQFVKQKLMFFLDNRVNRTIDFQAVIYFKVKQ